MVVIVQTVVILGQKSGMCFQFETSIIGVVGKCGER